MGFIAVLGGVVELVPLFLYLSCSLGFFVLLYIKSVTPNGVYMPSKKPRIALTVDENINDVLEDLSELMNKPKSAIIMDFLRDIYPFLEDMRDSLKHADDIRSQVPYLAKLSALANSKVSVINNDMADLLKQYDWVDEQK